MTFNVSLSVKRQTSEGHSPSLSFCNPCKETTMKTVLNLETLLLSPLFSDFESANVTMNSGKKTITITAGTTTFSKVVDQVVIGSEGGVMLIDGCYKVTKESDGLLFEKIKEGATEPSAPAKASRTSGCAFNPKLV